MSGRFAAGVAHPGDAGPWVVRMRDFRGLTQAGYVCSMHQAFLEQARAFVPAAEAAGVPGAVLVAQAVLESNWGRSGLARAGNAWFGIKATPGWPGRVYSGTTREWSRDRGYITIPGTHRVYGAYAEAVAAGCTPGSLFRAYDSVAHNVRDYLRFFRLNPRYHGALRRYAAAGDPRIFTADLAAAGYATAPDYTRRLITLMERVAADLLPPRLITLWLGEQRIPASELLLNRGRVFVRIRSLASVLGWRIAYDAAGKAVHVSNPRRGA